MAGGNMEWDLLGWIGAAEALLLVLTTLPWAGPVRNVAIVASYCMLQPLVALLPFCFYLLLDIYWEHLHLPTCHHKLPSTCPLHHQFRHDTWLLKSQRNLALVLVTLLLYWLLFCVTAMLVQLENLSEQVKESKRPTTSD